MTDPLAQWWVHTLQVRRYTGPDASGVNGLADPVSVTGFYSDKTEYSGGQVVASGRFAFPADVPYIPVQSEVILPDLFGGRVCQVVSTAVGDGGGQPVPAHQEIGVL